MDPKKPTMMPGQSPYTANELDRLYNLLEGPAELNDQLTSEEVDEMERELERRQRRGG